MLTLEQLGGWGPRLSQEAREASASVRKWLDVHYRPGLNAAHRQAAFDRKHIPALGALGVFGTSLEGYGCPGMGAETYALVLQELERVDSGLRSVCSVQGSLVMWPIHQFGTEDQKQEWLPRLARGEVLGCFGLTEASAGSDPAAMSAVARRADGGYRLDGIKCWITNAPLADVALVWAKVPDEEDRVSGFLVRRGAEGFTTPDIDGKFSLRASPTGELHLNDCFVPESDRLPVSGLKAPLQCLNEARFGISFGVLGAAMECYEVAHGYAMERQVFGRALAQTQLCQDKLAEMASRIVTAQLSNLHFLRLKEEGLLLPAQVSLMKRASVQVARDAAQMARTILGAVGITDAYPVMRHLMNLESVYTYEGTHEVHSLVLGRALTGLSAF